MQYDRPYNDEINIGDLFSKLKEFRKYIFRKWWIVLIAAVVVAFGLRAYIKWHPENYISHCDFVVKGVEGESTSSLASLASSFGIGISTGSEFTNEYFQGLIMSRSLVKETLMQKKTMSVKRNTAPREDYLCNFYIEMYPKWAKKKKVKNFSLAHGSVDSITRTEDSVLNVLYDEITENDLTVEFGEDVGMNQLEFASISRDFSYAFVDYIVRATSDFYINSQVVNEVTTVNLFQENCDSIKREMESRENMLATLQDRSAFTIKATGLLTQGRLLRDIELLNVQYATSYSQLELARFDMKNKTPLVTLTDTPANATVKEKEQTTLFMIIGFILGAFLCSVILIIRKYIKDSVEESKQKQLLIMQHKNEENKSLIENESNKI